MHITAEPPEKEVRTIQQIIEDIWSNRDRDYNIRCLIRRLQRIDKEMSGEARDQFAAYIPDGDMASYAKGLANRLRTDFTSTMNVLRNADFQDLLINYPRAARTFIVAYETQDEVTSQWLVRDSQGNEYKPEDYLSAFARFVKENPAKVEAIEILLNRPKHWSTQALSELQTKLSASTLRFTVENLQKAYKLRYDKALVDIISMIKHAASEQEPLYTASERVQRAFDKVTAGKQFTSEQQKWVDRIREHLIANLSIDKSDFEIVPVFTRYGGWGRANVIFNNQLENMIQDLNEAVAA